ncbi:MAG: choice-of-anchor D domain-containing protein [Candidatus Cloacimonetes bacterium]|nr:choice-of-anchor D domain-containing protein [Candidatus Cloacimonadota bacterium]MCF7814920.1 choice-of-anchor D domain-containing protein [Candidatus Cloacimonadota bacterium]
MRRLILVFCLILMFTLLSAEWTIVQTYTIPGKASGLAWDGTNLYSGIYGANGGEVYQIDPATGSSTLLFTGPQNDSFGMTHDGTNIWITDHVTSSSVPATAVELSNSGTILSQFDLPDHYMSGIAYDSGNFWVATYYPDDPSVVYQVDNTGTILQQFNFDIPGNDEEQPWDICMQDGDLWIADYYADALYRVDTSGTIIEEHTCENLKPAGIVYDGTYLWYVDGPLNNNSTLYKVDLGGAGTPAISLGWDDYDFGNVTIGQPASVELPVTNNGTADLVINNLDFTLDDFYSDETLPITITPGSTTDVTVIFDPVNWGQLNCSLFVNSNDPVNPSEEVTLAGYGVNSDPSLVVTPTSLNYGSVRIGALTGKYLEISNQGSGNLEITQFEFDDNQFILDNTVTLPLTIAPANSENVRIWFSPQVSGGIAGTLTIHSNDPANPNLAVTLNGTGDDSQYDIGTILWQYDIDTSYDNTPKALAPIEDINGDGVGDVIICSEDNFVRCFNGNASGTGDILWEHEIYAGDVYHQNSLAVKTDLNGDGFDDVVCGTVGGDRAIRAISGLTGELLWIYNTNNFGDGGWVYQVDVSYDYNNDGILDALAAAGNDGLGTGPQRVFCIDGTNGSIIWDFFLNGPKFSCIGIEDITNDGIPDAIGGGSNGSETEGKVWGIDGSNGTQLWEFTAGGSSVWALEIIDDITGNGIKDVVAGDFGGNYYALDSFTGSMQWNGSIGSGLVLRFEKLDDVNGDGHPDIAIARSTQNNALVIDGYTGSNVWFQPVADQPWVVDRIDDITGDGINDVVYGTLYNSNFGYFMNGATGEVLSQTPINSAVDGITGIPDVAGDGSWEMVCGGRDGEVVCISGGQTAAMGYLEGTITLNGGNGNVENSTVEIGTMIATVDPSGYYFAVLVPGAYEVTFGLTGYETLTVADVIITENQTTTLDVTLDYTFAPQNLTYTLDENDVILTWDAPSTTRDVTSYKVYRDDNEIAEVTELTYTDEDLNPATYEYYVTAIYEDGQESEPSNTIMVEVTSSGSNTIPLVTKLYGNYPNPFNPTTNIRFDLAKDTSVQLQVYNMKGQIVKTLVENEMNAGRHNIEWNGKDDSGKSAASGMYFYKIKTADYRANGKCILLK